MDLLAIARALHVLAVVLWIGGVGFVTTVMLPGVRRLKTPAERVAFFDAIERRFAWQARATTLLAGLTGLLYDNAARSVGPLSKRYLLVDARDGRRVALIHDHAVRRRAACPASLVS